MAPNRNESCPCGSGRKYKRCHGAAAAASPVSPHSSPAPPAAVHLRTALTRLAAGDLAGAEQVYRSVLAADAHNAEALNQLGSLLCQRGQAAEGEKVLRTAISRHPRLASAHVNLGIAMHRLGRTEEAEDLLRRALALNLTTLRRSATSGP